MLSLCLPLVAECSSEIRPSSNFSLHFMLLLQQSPAEKSYSYSREEQDVKFRLIRF